MIQLLDEAKIEYRRAGTHRRVRFEALVTYKRRADAELRAVLAKRPGLPRKKARADLRVDRTFWLPQVAAKET